MSNQWLRLWHDMPTDPKWRTIARTSGQPICTVLAIYLHLLVSASRNVTRGHADVTLEDIASALDVTEADVTAAFDAMQGRVLDGFSLTGWETRQPKKEDAGDASTGAKSATERKREERARKAALVDVTTSHDESRKVTLDKEEDKDKEDSFSASSDAKQKKASRKSQVSPSFQPDESGVKASNEAGLDVGVELRKFIDHHEAKGSVMASWQAAWRTWIRNAAAFRDARGGKPTPTAAADKPSWLDGTGFPNVWEANNAGCFASNAADFRKAAA